MHRRHALRFDLRPGLVGAGHFRSVHRWAYGLLLERAADDAGGHGVEDTRDEGLRARVEDDHTRIVEAAAVVTVAVACRAVAGAAIPEDTRREHRVEVRRRLARRHLADRARDRAGGA